MFLFDNFDNVNNQKEELNYDTILATLDILFKKKIINNLSPVIKDIIDNSTLQTQNDNVEEKLSDILNDESQENIEEEYLGLFSPDTKNFIINHLPNGVKGKLILTIDDTTRGNEYSNKSFNLRVSGLNYNDDIIDHDTDQYKNLEGLKTICEELLKYNYLGLGVE